MTCFRTRKNNKRIRFSYVPNCFFCFKSEFVRGSVQSYEKWSFCSVFSRLGNFPQVFRQVKEWRLLELHEVIRVHHIVAFPIVFLLFCLRSWQGRVFKFMEIDHFLMFLAVFVYFPKFLVRSRDDLDCCFKFLFHFGPFP